MLPVLFLQTTWRMVFPKVAVINVKVRKGVYWLYNHLTPHAVSL